MTSEKKSQGKVYLVGAGPGDPRLLTLRGVELLRQADAVVYDALASSALLQWAAPSAERIDVGKRGYDTKKCSQEEIEALLIALARAGKRVVRLKGGDPFIFGRGGEEASALAAAGLDFEVIPGVSASSAVPGYAGIPLTDRRYATSFAVVTGHHDASQKLLPIRWGELARNVDTLVILMGMKNLRKIVSEILQGGRNPNTPAAAIMWGATPKQRVVTSSLMDLPDAVAAAGLENPATIVIGEVVNLRETLAWYEQLPMWGLRVLVTRTREQAVEMMDALYAVGAEPIVHPMIRIVPPQSWEALDRALAEIACYDFLIFTSQNAVQAFFERAQFQSVPYTNFRGTVVCVGPKTAESARQAGLSVQRVPTKHFDAEGVLELFAGEDLAGKRILIPSAEKVRAVLREGLLRAGARVDTPVAYRTLAPEVDLPSVQDLSAQLVRGDFDILTFTSPSTVQNFLTVLGASARCAIEASIVAAIGPITQEALRKAGFQPQIVAQESSAIALVDALCASPLVQARKEIRFAKMQKLSLQSAKTGEES